MAVRAAPVPAMAIQTRPAQPAAHHVKNRSAAPTVMVLIPKPVHITAAVIAVIARPSRTALVRVDIIKTAPRAVRVVRDITVPAAPPHVWHAVRIVQTQPQPPPRPAVHHNAYARPDIT